MLENIGLVQLIMLVRFHSSIDSSTSEKMPMSDFGGLLASIFDAKVLWDQLDSSRGTVSVQAKFYQSVDPYNFGFSILKVEISFICWTYAVFPVGMNKINQRHHLLCGSFSGVNSILQPWQTKRNLASTQQHYVQYFCNAKLSFLPALSNFMIGFMERQDWAQCADLDARKRNATQRNATQRNATWVICCSASQGRERAERIP
jgi:hypothetical protein